MVKIEVAIDDIAEKIVKAFTKAAQAGKVFILNLDTAVRVGTSETKSNALQRRFN